MLLQAMAQLEAEWHLDDPSSYGAKMVAGSAQDGLTKLLRGFANTTISELFYERLDDAWITKDRKDEESCFSESTLADLSANARGVEDLYLGRYGQLFGPSPSSLVTAKDSALDQSLRDQLAAARQAIDAIPPPFDHAVLSPAGTDPHDKVQAAIDAFAPMRDLIVKAAGTVGVTINL
jgi:putative iron-regulated protein